MADIKQRARDQARELYQQSILEAAERVFIEHGFARARMADIASEAGLATGTLYNYFRNKESIFAEMMEHIAEAFFSRLTGSAANIESPLERLLSRIEVTAAFMSDNRGIYRVFSELGTGQGLPDEISEKHQQLSERFHGLLVDTVREAIDAGELRSEFDAESLALVIGGCQQGLLDASLALSEGPPLADVTKLFTHVLLKGVLP